MLNVKEKSLLTKIDTKLDAIGKKLDGHLSEHFKIRLVMYAGIGTLIISLIL
jgi:hypothetical protein